MWVTVTAVLESGLLGVLGNRPDEPTASPTLGGRIAFERHQIVAVGWDDPPPRRRLRSDAAIGFAA